MDTAVPVVQVVTFRFLSVHRALQGSSLKPTAPQAQVEPELKVVIEATAVMAVTKVVLEPPQDLPAQQEQTVKALTLPMVLRELSLRSKLYRAPTFLRRQTEFTATLTATSAET